MLPVGTLQSAFDSLIAGVQYLISESQVVGGQLNGGLVEFGTLLFGALSAIPPFPSF
jgi:hypothetical protein